MSGSAQHILLIGASDTGKTHYGTQLLGRLRHRRDSALTLDSSIADLTLFAEALGALENGQTAEHTASKTHDQVKLTLRTAQRRQVDLYWPEYGGEQIKDILNLRSIGSQWHEQLKHSGRWMLFIRPRLLRRFGQNPDEIVVRLAPRHTVPQPASQKDVLPWDRWDDNAKLIELLQILMHVNACSTLERRTTPRLAIMLSCVDELSDEERTQRPAEILQRYLPLFAHFITANWQPAAWTVWGVAPIGRTLKKGQVDTELAVTGPEHYGYVLTPDAKQHQDLTLPLHWLIESGS